MTRTALKSIVAEIFESDPTSINLDTDLRTLPAFDSVNVLALMIALDEQAGIKLGPEQAANLGLFRELEAIAAAQGIQVTEN